MQAVFQDLSYHGLELKLDPLDKGRIGTLSAPANCPAHGAFETRELKSHGQAVVGRQLNYCLSVVKLHTGLVCCCFTVVLRLKLKSSGSAVTACLLGLIWICPLAPMCTLSRPELHIGYRL